MREKIEQINELLELTDVIIQDDYFTDIFRNPENNEILFYCMSSRGFENHPEKEEEVLNYIIEQLTEFKNSQKP